MRTVLVFAQVLLAAISSAVPQSLGAQGSAANSVANGDSISIELRVHALKPGATLASGGIPFQSGALDEEDLSRLRIEVDGREIAAFVAPLATWKNGSLRSVLVQFETTDASGARPRLVVRTGAAPLRRPRSEGELGLPDAVVLPRSVEYLVETELMGPTVPQSVTHTLGREFGKYEVEFKRLADRHWRMAGDKWDDNYYDRALIFYTAWMRSGDPEFWHRATRIALNYRRRYLEKNSYKSTPHWAQLGGLELHYLLTGDTLSRRAVAGVFAWGLSSFAKARPGTNPALDNKQSEYMENRIQARVMQGALASYRMQASYRSDGRSFPASEWPATLRNILNKTLASQEANGSYSWAQICGGQLNYMVGLLNDVLIEYYRDFEADPRIPGAIERANEYLWTTQWLPNDKAFKYASVRCTPNKFGTNVGGMTAAGDLNGLMVTSFGWLYQQTGDVKWRQRGDAIFAGMFAPRWLANYNGSKQFNQAYTSSYRYLGYRAHRP